MDTRLLRTTVLVAALVLSAPSVAQKSSDRGGDAAAAVAEATGGRVLSVRRKGDYYSVKVLTDRGRARNG